LSRAVSLKFMVREYVGRISPRVWVLKTRSRVLGKLRVRDVTGSNERKIGALPTGEFGWPAGPLSNSSQQ